MRIRVQTMLKSHHVVFAGGAYHLHDVDTRYQCAPGSVGRLVSNK